jgi:hypothetical protein
METIIEKHLRVHKGYSFMVLVEIGFEINNAGKNNIINEVETVPFKSQGFIEGGHSEWVQAAELAIGWAIKKADPKSYLNVYILRLEGRQFLETNPTVIGTTTVKAVWKYLNYTPQKSISEKLDVLNLESRKMEDQLAIPNFEKI